jgi:membrane-bound serine protease (ClpP class)
MNTYGGTVVDADSIRTKILNSQVPIWVFIDNNAASAGALISIACDSIFMRPGANIGAATVVNQTGEKAPDKYQSYFRSIMRATAESHGNDTIITDKTPLFVGFATLKLPKQWLMKMFT